MAGNVHATRNPFMGLVLGCHIKAQAKQVKAKMAASRHKQVKAKMAAMESQDGRSQVTGDLRLLLRAFDIVTLAVFVLALAFLPIRTGWIKEVHVIDLVTCSRVLTRIFEGVVTTMVDFIASEAPVTTHMAFLISTILGVHALITKLA